MRFKKKEKKYFGQKADKEKRIIIAFKYNTFFGNCFLKMNDLHFIIHWLKIYKSKMKVLLKRACLTLI